MHKDEHAINLPVRDTRSVPQAIIEIAIYKNV